MCGLCWRPCPSGNVHRRCIIELSEATRADRAWVTSSGLIYGPTGLHASPRIEEVWDELAESYRRDLGVYA